MKKLALFVIFAFAISVPAFAGVFYTQVFDQTGNAYASQYDPITYGLFAQMYDNFKTAAGHTLTEIQWTGGYWNGSPTPMSEWLIGIYDDNAGQPGNLIYEFDSMGTGNETYLGTYGSTPIYTYDVVLGTPFAVAAGTQYWLSVVPVIGFPPQWGWASANGGDGVSYQDFLGARTQLSVDMAFNLIENQVVPEPSIFLMMGAGALGAAGVLRRKLF